MLRLTATDDLVETRRSDGSLRAAFASLASLLRNVSFLRRRRPATPLRILCIAALDTIHQLRHASPLSRQRREELAILLDFQACANAAWDDKPVRSSEYRALRERLEAAGLASWIRDYLERLRHLETERPAVGHGVHCFNAVREYREAVVRLSLATVAGIALDVRHLDEAIDATQVDGDLAALFQMAMQCQVIDDVLDYRGDAASGLPSFLTAAPLPQALASTAGVVQSHGVGRTPMRAMLPLRLARRVLTAVAALSVGAASWIYDERLPASTGQRVS